jgi:hypothetical protein
MNRQKVLFAENGSKAGYSQTCQYPGLHSAAAAAAAAGSFISQVVTFIGEKRSKFSDGLPSSSLVNMKVAELNAMHL